MYSELINNIMREIAENYIDEAFSQWGAQKLFVAEHLGISNDILKQKSEFAHQDNIKAKSDLELVKGRAEEIYAEFDNN